MAGSLALAGNLFRKEVANIVLSKNCSGCEFLACGISRVLGCLSVEVYRGARGVRGMRHLGVR